MKTSIFQGYNAGQIPYNFFATLRLYGKYPKGFYDLTINKLFDEIEAINLLTYSVETSYDYYSRHHAHILMSTDNPNKFTESLVSYLNPIWTDSGEKIVLAKIPKKDYDLKNEVKFKDQKVAVHYDKYNCKRLEFYVENIVNPINAAVYTFKCSDYGLNTDTLIR